MYCDAINCAAFNLSKYKNVRLFFLCPEQQNEQAVGKFVA